MAFLSAPDASWRDAYATVEADLTAALAQWHPQIEHIGSTSVPDLHAKPLIDVLAGIPEEAVDDPSVKKAFEALGYRQASRQPSLRRRIFIRRGATPRVNVHLVPYEGEAWTQLMLTRDLLREDPEVAASYVAMKQRADAVSGGDYRKYRARKVLWFQELAGRLEEFHHGRSGGRLDVDALNQGVGYSPGEDPWTSPDVMSPVTPALPDFPIPLDGEPGSEGNPILGDDVGLSVVRGQVYVYPIRGGDDVQEFQSSDGTYRVEVVD